MKAPKLFVALDGLRKKQEETLVVARQLAEVEGDFGFKANLDYVLKVGLAPALGTLKDLGREVFIDLKMWNGGRTMAEVVEECAKSGVGYVNAYALADDELANAVKATEGTDTQVLAVTVLTHYDDAYCQKHFKRSLSDAVYHLAATARERGCHGVILPGTCLGSLRGLNLVTCVPGVRPEWFTDSRHSEEAAVTPAEAREGGADLVVCGSPIMKSKNPVEDLRRILEELRG